MNEENLEKIDGLVDSWLSIGEVAEALETTVPRVKSLVERRALLGVQKGSPKVYSIPEKFVKEGRPLENLKGTLISLHDAGFSDDEAIIWLFTQEDSLGTTPIEALREGTFKTQVRRVIQSLAW